ncbi:MAG: DUF3168 domain-containing protein [Bdellovibrionales bacterium]
MTGLVFKAQEAVYAALAGDAGVQASLGSPPRLYDHVPEDASFPYIAFGVAHIAPDDSKMGSAFEHTLTLDIFSRYRGAKEAKEILQAVYAALHRAGLVAVGASFPLCVFHSAEIAPLDDGLTTHIAARFTVLEESA